MNSNVRITRHKNNIFKQSTFMNRKNTCDNVFLFKDFPGLENWKITLSVICGNPASLCAIANTSKMPITLAIAIKCEEWSLSADDSTVNTRQLPAHHHSPRSPHSPPAEHFVHLSPLHQLLPTSAEYQPDWTVAENSVPETATVCSWADADSSTFHTLDKLFAADSLPVTHTRINLR